LHFCQKEIIFRPDLAKLLPSPKKLIENLQDNQSCFVCVDSEIFAKANDIIIDWEKSHPFKDLLERMT